MENIYEPYGILVSEDGEILALVEPNYRLEQLFEKNIEPELMIDVDYYEDEDDFFLTVSVVFDDTEIFFELPYGEAWDDLMENEAFAIAIVSKKDFEAGKVENIPVIEIGLNELNLGFIEGAKRTVEVLLGETEEEE